MMKQETCLILGGCGFMGSHLAEALLAAGYRVRLFDRQHVDTANVAHLLAEVELYEGDFTNVAEVSAAVQGVTCIFHLISTTLPSTSNDNPAYDLESNVVSTLHLLDAAVQAGVRKIVFSSSGGTIYGVPTEVPIPESAPTNPFCAYGISKLMIEKYLVLYRHLHGLDFCSLRIANPYGERQNPNAAQGAVTVFLARAWSREPIIIWGDGSVTRDYLYVGDVIEAFVKALHSPSPQRIFNVGSGRGVSLRELLRLVQVVTGVDLDVRHTAARKLDVPVSILDTRLIGRELNWTPRVSLEEGMAMTWEWIRKTSPRP
ncbi:MAG: NAD-dependent epimerase/dehydratase family protein [Candidatus Tectomicrobia bacterium]|nr:NAD-dependent epimerase/dehydratase family protein [Candidatus Tectomicrobia bacterium]